tara:strand:- start:347 stop:817 length:471 start_codon:yes stop_codon:yes gene_type:complete
MIKIILILISSYFFLESANSKVKNQDVYKWQKISDTFYIDTKSFNVENPLIYFWVKNPLYKKRRLTINCSTSEEREKYKQEYSEWKPVFPGDIKYELINQLCFLVNDNNFQKERRPPVWAAQIIDNQAKKLKIKENNETKKKLDDKDTVKKKILVD